jgi:hypothetical protein
MRRQLQLLPPLIVETLRTVRRLLPLLPPLLHAKPEPLVQLRLLPQLLAPLFLHKLRDRGRSYRSKKK